MEHPPVISESITTWVESNQSDDMVQHSPTAPYITRLIRKLLDTILVILEWVANRDCYSERTLLQGISNLIWFFRDIVAPWKEFHSIIIVPLASTGIWSILIITYGTFSILVQVVASLGHGPILPKEIKGRVHEAPVTAPIISYTRAEIVVTRCEGRVLSPTAIQELLSWQQRVSCAIPDSQCTLHCVLACKDPAGPTTQLVLNRSSHILVPKNLLNILKIAASPSSGGQCWFWLFITFSLNWFTSQESPQRILLFCSHGGKFIEFYFLVCARTKALSLPFCIISVQNKFLRFWKGQTPLMKFSLCGNAELILAQPFIEIFNILTTHCWRGSSFSPSFCNESYGNHTRNIR